jgi:hypothetical protein
MGVTGIIQDVVSSCILKSRSMSIDTSAAASAVSVLPHPGGPASNMTRTHPTGSHERIHLRQTHEFAVEMCGTKRENLRTPLLSSDAKAHNNRSADHVLLFVNFRNFRLLQRGRNREIETRRRLKHPKCARIDHDAPVRLF